MRRRGLWLGLLIGLLLGLVLNSVPARSNNEDWDALVEEFFRPLAWLVAQVDNNYVEQVDRQKLLVGAYQGMLSALDRYCAFWPQDMVKEFEADLEGQFGGLGIQITWDPVNKGIRVEQPIAGMPAFREGVLAGDLIVQVKEEATSAVTKIEDLQTVHDAIRVLRGKPGTKVTITVIHGESGKKEDLTITRELIRIPGVRAVEMIDGARKIGYVYVPYFSKPMAEDLRKAIRDLENQGARGLVIDLRLNPGGLLKAAEECADMFLRGGVIVRVRTRDGSEEVHKARRGTVFGDIPLVILINRFSASGAEIVAAALRDNGRAKLVGEPTFGKASVQTVVENPTMPGTAIKLTVARYYTPNGELIEGKGVPPDVEVKLPEEETRKLARHLSMKTDYPPPSPEKLAARATEGEEEEPQPQELLRDVQLERAVQVMAELLGEPVPLTVEETTAVAAPAAPVTPAPAGAGGP